jgi:5,10-methylenetetrahydromethanopterin reductase
VRGLEATVRALRALLAGERAGADGFGIRFAGGLPPPVYVVATGPRALEVAGRVADGVVLNVGTHPAVLGAARERVAAGARAAGRDPSAVDLVAFAFCLIDPDPEAARARLKPSVSWFCQRFPALAELAGLPLGEGVRAELARFEADYARYDLVHAAEWDQAVRDAAFLPAPYVDAFALGGSAADVAGRIGRLAELGFRSVLLRPPSTEDWWPTARAVIEGVVPVLR